ncbi:hypothetical protein, partial [Streptomyces sp. AC627_RSS907]|uniref:hypothetical protein n=1 Tax=Streptomyces sp. AC627_RSS907 TaxID=2823684 RepID=UPI001C2763F4
ASFRSLEWVIWFTLDESGSMARVGLDSIKHRHGRPLGAWGPTAPAVALPSPVDAAGGAHERRGH